MEKDIVKICCCCGDNVVLGIGGKDVPKTARHALIKMTDTRVSVLCLRCLRYFAKYLPTWKEYE